MSDTHPASVCSNYTAELCSDVHFQTRGCKSRQRNMGISPAVTNVHAIVCLAGWGTNTHWQSLCFAWQYGHCFAFVSQSAACRRNIFQRVQEHIFVADCMLCVLERTIRKQKWWERMQQINSSSDAGTTVWEEVKRQWLLTTHTTETPRVCFLTEEIFTSQSYRTHLWR